MKKIIQEYIVARIELVKIEIVDKTSKSIAKLVSALIIFSFFMLFFLFINIFGAFVIGEYYFDNWMYGFGGLAALYFFLFLFLLLTKKFLIERPIVNNFIKNFFKEKKEKKHNEDEEED